MTSFNVVYKDPSLCGPDYTYKMKDVNMKSICIMANIQCKWTFSKKVKSLLFSLSAVYKCVCDLAVYKWRSSDNYRVFQKESL